MQKTKVFGLLGITFVLMAVTFNNCGKVQFQNMPESAKLSSSSTEGSDGFDGSNITDEEINEIISQVPAEEIATIRPITDLQDPNDEYLFDVYACGDGGVLICHFPATLEGATQCIGRPAVDSHYDHIRVYGDNKQIGDYLGNCRVSL